MGVETIFDKYEVILKTFHEIQSDCSSGSVKNHYLFGTLYLRKNVLPNLSALSKTFQAGNLNFSRIIPSISGCKTKIHEIEKNGKVWDVLEQIWEVD